MSETAPGRVAFTAEVIATLAAAHPDGVVLLCDACQEISRGGLMVHPGYPGGGAECEDGCGAALDHVGLCHPCGLTVTECEHCGATDRLHRVAVAGIAETQRIVVSGDPRLAGRLLESLRFDEQLAARKRLP
jgi:hypothetical protein